MTFPHVYQKLLDGVDFLNFDMSWVLSVGCFLEVDFHDRLLWTTITPVVLMCFLGLTYAVAVLKYGRSSEIALRNARQKHISMALLVTFLVYSSVSSVVFQMFACDDLDDRNLYLRADYTITCDSPKHRALQIYASLMIVLYPVGIPTLYACLLFSHRRTLQSERGREESPEVMPTLDLWKPYKPQHFYYEVVECGRRILLAGVVVFIYPNTAAQIAVTVALAVVAGFVSESISPYQSKWDAWINRIGHVVVFASMYLALLLKIDVSSENTQSQKTFEVILVAVHGCMILAVIMEAILMAVYLRTEKQREDPNPRRRHSSKFRVKIEASLDEGDDDGKYER